MTMTISVRCGSKSTELIQRMNLTLIDKVLAIAKIVGLNRQYSEEAVLYAAYLHSPATNAAIQT